MRMVLMAVATALCVGAAGCGSRNDRNSNATSTIDTVAANTRSADTAPAEGSGATVTNREWSDVSNARADGFGTDPVELAGLVYKDAPDSLLVYGDLDRERQPAEVYGSYPGIRRDDYVLVRGTILGADSYDPVDRGSVDVVKIDGVSVSPISRDRAFALANAATGRKRLLGLSRSQSGFRVTLESIEWTADATRLMVTFTNRGSAKARIRASDTVIQQGLRQYDLSRKDQSADALSDDIRPGGKKTKTLTFTRASRKRGKAYIEFDWHSDKRDLKTDKPFAFIMRWKP